MPVQIGPRIGITGEQEYRRQINNIISQTKKLNAETKQMESSWNKDTTAQQKAAQQTQMLNQQIEAQKRKIEELNNYINKATEEEKGNETQMNKWREALANANTELNRLESELEKVPNSLEIAGQQMQDFGDKVQSVGGHLSSAGDTLTKSVTGPLMGLGGIAVKTTADFDESMSKVAALSGATGQEFDTLRQTARDLGSTTRYSASEAADALSYMALAGFSTEDMLGSIDGVLQLAAASGMDLAEASDLVTDYLSAFGLEAEDATRMADELAYAQANSNTTTIQLGEAFGNSAAQMHTAGQTMETTTALLEAFANQGLKGSEAGTALAAVVRDITQNMEDGKIMIGDTAVAVTDSEGNFRNLIDILGDVEDATDGMGSAEKSAALMTTFTARSVKGVSVALTEGTDNIKDYEEELGNADGSAQNMAETMQDNLSGQMTMLKSELQELAISFGDILVPEIRKGVSWFSKQIEAFSKLDRKTKTQIIKYAALAAAMGPVLSITGRLTTGIGKLITGAGKVVSKFGEWQKAAAETGSIITAMPTAATVGLTAALAAGTVALAAYIAKTRQSSGAFGEFNSAMQEIANSASDAAQELSDATDQVNEAVKGAQDTLSNNEAQAAYARDLASELAELNSQTSLTTDEQLRMKAVLDELKQIYPDFTGEIDDNTGKLNINTQEIWSNIDALEKQAKAQAFQEAYAQITEEVVNQQTKMYRTTAELAKVEAELNDPTNEYNRIAAEQEAIIERLVSQGWSLGDATEYAAGQQTEFNGKQQTYAKILQDLEPGHRALLDSQAELNREMEEAQTAYDSATGELEYLQQMEEQFNTENAQEEFDKATQAAIASGNSFDGMAGSIDTGMKNADQKISENAAMMQRNIGTYGNQWSTASKASGGKIPSGVKIGVDQKTGLATGAVQSMNALVTSKVEGGLSGAAQSANEQGASISSNTAAGIDSKSGQAYFSAENLTEAARKPLRGMQNDTRSWGEHAGQNFADGVGSKEEAARAAASRVAQAAANILKHSTPKEGPLKDDDVWGIHLAENFAEGITRGIPMVERATDNLALATQESLMVDPDLISGHTAMTASIEHTLLGSADLIYDAIVQGMNGVKFQIDRREFQRILHDVGVATA